MSDVTTLPTHGEVFLDARGGDRSMRLSWHHETGPDGVVVLSLWRSGLCVGSFRLRSREVPLLIDALARGIGGSWPAELGPAMPPHQGQQPQQGPQQGLPAPGPPPVQGPPPAWPPVAPAAQDQPGPPPGAAQPAASPQRRRLHAAGQQPGYHDVRPTQRYLENGPPNSSGAESWSA